MRFLSGPKNSKDENLKNKQINKNKINYLIEMEFGKKNYLKARI